MEADASLTAPQRQVLDLVRQGHNVFFTGNAGTGKTYLMERLVDDLRRRYGGDKDFRKAVAVTATTGVAATHIGGQTLNSALGFGAVSRVRDFETMTTASSRRRLKELRVLLIDECSMLSGEMLDEIEAKLREAREDPRPAGGLQIVLSGDFFQLPPVSRRPKDNETDRETGSVLPGVFLNRGFAFGSRAWERCAFRSVVLTHVHRQKDPTLVEALDIIRRGSDDDGRKARNALRRIVRACGRPLSRDDGIVPTMIFARNKDVDDTNEQEMRRLVSGGAKRVMMEGDDDVAPIDVIPDKGESLTRARQKTADKLWGADFFRDCLVWRKYELCVGAQVMLLRNLDTLEGRVNGSRGVVVSFVRAGDVISPSASAPAMSVCGYVDDEAARRWGVDRPLPVVRFADDGRELVIPPARITYDLYGTGTCSRVQVPLKAAWAITVHKSQGMTLDAVAVSLCDMFAVGQAYVALSRARSVEGLQILDWDLECLRTDAEVVAFYRSIHLR